MKSIVVSDEVHKNISQKALDWGVPRNDVVKMMVEEYDRMGKKKVK